MIAIDAQVALGRRARPEVIRLVGQADVQGVAVAVRIDGDDAQPHLAAGADDAHGNLAAIGDEDLERRGSTRLGHADG